ncbi:hypothetical protein LPJ66_002628 [Kickxella alabastrina]|uniref:Uncharacterized protein n=1 Tax=Kickxella alabastrina TaxID=61397 RepID=A0ACC1IQ96_9FUNG|nr:hypothetical protein LPJ66_002628 [Kickxella alabastrina]
MAMGLNKKHQQAPVADASSSSLALATPTATPSTPSVSLGWRFPQRADPMSLAKPSGHHIIHANMKDGIDKLNEYLRNETEHNSGKSAHNDGLSTAGRLSPFHSTASDYQGLRAAPQLRRKVGSVTNYSWHSLAQLDGDQGLRQMRAASNGSRTVRLNDMLGFSDGAEENVANTYPGHLIASPPTNRQISGDHGHRDIRVFGSASTDEIVILAAQSPPINFCHSPPYMRNSSRTHRSTTENTDANTIINLYTDDSDAESMHGSAHGGRNRRRCSDTSSNCGSTSKLCTASGLAILPLATGNSLSDADILDAASVPLPKTPSTFRSGSSGDNRSRSSSINDSTSSSENRKCCRRTGMQHELRQRLICCLQDEFSNSVQNQELRTTNLLQEAEDQFKRLLADQDMHFSQKLAGQQQMHSRELSQREQALQQPIELLRRELASVSAERDELHAMLDDYVTTSSKLIKHKDAENSGLSHELGKMAVERQRLHKKIQEHDARAQALSNERSEAQERVDALAAENLKLENQNSNLGSDVMVAEERNARIRELAEATLAQANAEIARLQQESERTYLEVAALRSSAAKADTKARSLQIQLDSTKRQNEELLSLCERLETSI